MAYYAVCVGRSTGIYTSWADCEPLVSGYPRAVFRRFETLRDARDFMRSSCPQYRRRKAPVWPVVYTDGACSDNGRPGARAGIGVYWGEDDERNVSARLRGRQTNNRAEIFAAIKAIRQAQQCGFTRLEIRTDSQFLVRSMTEWIYVWRDRDWISSKGQPIVNRDDFERVLNAMNGMVINWLHIPGHAGVPGNEAADWLANRGMQEVY